MSRVTEILEARPSATADKPQPTGMVDNALYGYCKGVTSDHGISIIIPKTRSEDPEKTAAHPWRTWLQYAIRDGKMNARTMQMAGAQPMEFMRRLVDFYDGCFVAVIEGEIRVFSRRPQAQVPSAFISQITKNTPDLEPFSPVTWFPTLNGKGQQVAAAQVLFGMDKEEGEYQSQKTADVQKELSKPGAKSNLRRQFWSPGGFDPDTAPDIVDKLLQ